MRTTIDIPDALFVRAKTRAAQKATSLKGLFVEALEEKLSAPLPSAKRRIAFPLVPSSRPGSNKLTAEKIEALDSDAEKADAS